MKYRRTRHNAGWILLESAGYETTGTWQSKFKGRWARTTVGGSPIILLKPETMMNLSGHSVQTAASFFKISPAEILVVHDDTELAFGRVSVRFGGGLAGHNGLRSISDRLSTRDFWRMRIGVGRPARGDLHAHVLGRFSTAEEAELPDLLSAATRLLEEQLRAGPADVPARDLLRGG